MSTSLRTHRSGGAGGLPSNPRGHQQQQQPPSQSRNAYAGYNDPPDTLFASSRAPSRAAAGRQDPAPPDAPNDYGGRADDRYGRAPDARYGRGNDRYAAPPDDRYGQQSYDDRPTSNTSTASSASSLLDRMKQRSNVSSARTSLDDDPQQATAAKASSSLRTRTAFQSRQREPEPDDGPARGAPVPSGEGSSIWGRMVAATSSLRVNVTTAISNVTREDGEETPPGQESRLTRAMKEHYLRKARDPNDLPAWLFEPTERSISSKPSNISTSTSSSSRSRQTARDEPPPTQSRGLRDIYDRAQQQQQQPLARSPTMAQSGDSRAASRLKAMREAKRSAVGATRDYDAYYRSDQPQPSQQQQYEPEPEPESRRPGRVGLPSRPGAGRY